MSQLRKPRQEQNGTEPRPLLRGWFHAGAALAAVVVTGLFAWQTHDDTVRLISLLIFGITLIELYSVSAVYHIGRWRGRVRTTLRAIDHANIFLVIAGTYTPLCV
ncbi:MAG: hemolysin III family protein, partial [Chloroflexota bacterium]